jgi:hypothetical protein
VVEPCEDVRQVSARRRSSKNHIAFLWSTLCLVVLTSGFVWTAGAQTAPKPSLTVTPSSPLNISGPEGGPFSPSSIQCHLSASRDTIRFAVAAPFWLTADPRVGTVGVDGVTVTLSISPQGLKLPGRVYAAPVTFTNVTNGQGSTSRTAKLTVQRSETPSQGYLLDETGVICGTIGESNSSRVNRWESGFSSTVPEPIRPVPGLVRPGKEVVSPLIGD